MTARNDATASQVEAARPDRSTWLSANAGSGKTRVLTDRVARLLLDGVDPQNILCLTYTKAAASEMQNRLFQRLGEWSMLDDNKLASALARLGLDGDLEPERLRQARRLFAAAIEVPGGLKIQTIHAFCASILRRFPLEAGVSPRFVEMDERAASLLRQEVLESIAAGPEAKLVAAVASGLSDDRAFDALTREIAEHAKDFSHPLSLDDALALFDLPAAFTESDLPGLVFRGDEPDLVRRVAAAASETSKTYQDFAEALAQALKTFDASGSLEPFYALCLYQSDDRNQTYRRYDSKSKNFPLSNHTKAVEAFEPVRAELHAFMDRVHDAKMAGLALFAARQTQALHAFAHAFLARYEEQKQLRGWLDFDDLIRRAAAMLNDPLVAAWVLYRLDGGIDHILVDEAQDTSPAQWNVIERLAQEFTSGEGARANIRRTIFVVGDKKQSIYSFQGADPREFDRMRSDFDARLSETRHPLAKRSLHYSFRSAQTILSLVDDAFRGKAASGFDPDLDHKAFFDAMPGRVDLWPVVLGSEDPQEAPWYEPVDQVGPDAPVSILARQVAGAIKQMIKGETIPEYRRSSDTFYRRAVRPGDVMVLVQRRSPLFHAIIRECKAAKVPVAGADRLRIGGELAVKDISALLRFLATPEDDLSLAAALRSPLFGLTEQQLFSLAHGRKGYLWEALRMAGAQHAPTLEILEDLRNQTDFLRPYELIERILTRHGRRQRLLARLGAEAEDGIDALLVQALAYERSTVPSLTGFLVWLESDDVEIKRQMETAGDQVRVMTVHGAKGLESPIVILPDCAKRPVQIKDMLIAGREIMLKPRADEMPPRIDRLIDTRKMREYEERTRLLYVAMTRAEKWLIVAAAGDPGVAGESWYADIRAAMEERSARPEAFEAGEGMRLESGDWSGLPLEEQEVGAEKEAVDMPEWVGKAPPAPISRPGPLSPSALGGAKALAGEEGLDEEAAKRRGRQIHRLLEHLPRFPAADRSRVAALLLSQGPDAAFGAELDSLLTEAERVLDDPALAPIFAADAVVEVPVSAALPELGGRRIHGVIDRLIISEASVLAVDFKTNAIVPESPHECPDGLLRQMGAYAAALRQIYPGFAIETALLWTHSPSLMRLPNDVVTKALADTQMLDPPPPDT